MLSMIKEIKEKEKLFKCDLNEKIIYRDVIYYIEEIHLSNTNKYVILENLKGEYIQIDID